MDISEFLFGHDLPERLGATCGRRPTPGTNLRYLAKLRIIPNFHINLGEKTSFYTFYKGQGMNYSTRILRINSSDIFVNPGLLFFNDSEKFSDVIIPFLISLKPIS